jgi:2-polyprenyl-6-methoxyphenol hydroxylase-like FAD-dependent oxidoreductase
VRHHVLGDGPPRYAGESIFRGIARHRLARPEVSRELFGAGRRAACYALSDGLVYWWATAPLAEGTLVPQAERRAFLRRAFSDFACGIPELIAATPAEAILQNDIFDRRPVRRWHRGRVVLLGDAAHPTTPNLGQGACMAIEDAVVLARAIAIAPDAEEAFQRFHAERGRRTARTVRLSRWWGRAGLLASPPLVALRDAALRSGPDGWMERRGAAQYVYDPGVLPLPSAPPEGFAQGVTPRRGVGG